LFDIRAIGLHPRFEFRSSVARSLAAAARGGDGHRGDGASIAGPRLPFSRSRGFLAPKRGERSESAKPRPDLPSGLKQRKAKGTARSSALTLSRISTAHRTAALR
jgi:hypothetical protein